MLTCGQGAYGALGHSFPIPLPGPQHKGPPSKGGGSSKPGAAACAAGLVADAVSARVM